MEFTLLWAVVTAGIFVWAGLRIWSDRVPDNGFDQLLGAGLVGLVAGRSTAMLSQGVNPIANIGDFIIIRGGVHTGAAALAFLGSIYWATRAKPGALDALAPAVLLGLAGWHAGCVWRESCLGTQSDLPWAWALESSDFTRHPVEIYAVLGLLVGAWWVSRLGWRPWLRSGAAIAIAAGVRLITEPLRPSITGGPVRWYVAGIVVGLGTAALGSRLSRSRAHAPT